ncbi:MAG: TIGR03013 family PEP-CTERM/XrtA system glycosyltransferase [Thalassotalea sp.]|nr:TIGR03013 family PEP-CTERM/XrtA system glycosyltransferase [Thalassotalea sp.]
MNNNNSNYSSLMLKLLICADIVLFVCAFVLSVTEPQLNIFEQGFILAEAFFVCTMLLSCLGLGLYKSKLRETLFGVLRRLLLASAMTYVLLAIVEQVIESPYLENDFLIRACALSFIFSALFRYLLFKYNILGFARRNVLVLGNGQRALIIEKRMRREVDRKGFNLVGFVHMPGDLDSEIAENHIITIDTNLLDYVVKNQVHEIVVATDERRDNLPVDELFACKLRGVKVTEILDFIEKETGQIAVNLIYPSWIIYSEGFHSSNDLRNTFDWLFNACLAVLLFIITWPFMLLAIIAIKLEDGLSAPVLYWQNRVGLHGEVFAIAKFRSMTTDAEKDGAKWSTESDSRITGVGHFIRKYRIDVLPQIYNVLCNDMGFVGPRPEQPEFVNDLKNKLPYYSQRHNVKSGITGWAQLKYPYGANEKDALEKLKFDLYYIKHRSFLLDLLILIQTAEVVLFGKGR